MANSKKNKTNNLTPRKRGRPPKAIVAPAESAPSEINNSTNSKPFLSNRKSLILVVLLVLLATLPGIYFYNKSRGAEPSANETEQAEKDEIGKLIKEISEHALLPTGEEPTVATVSDVTKLENQAFFAEAKNGDKVLVYSEAKKVVLYRPSIKKVINMTPLNIGEEVQTGTSETQTQ